MHMDELKSQKIWFCWYYARRRGKKTKVPVSAFGTETGTRYAVVPVLVTTYGLKANMYSGGICQQVTMDDLYKDLD